LMWWVCVALGLISALMHLPIKEIAVERLTNSEVKT